ncbi:hypothetical protein ABZY05_41850 [Streptomyces canus]
MPDTGADDPDHLRLIGPDQAPSTLTESRAIALRREAETLR